MTPRRVLFALSDTGFGHRAAANAISTALHEQLGDEVETDLVDLYGELEIPVMSGSPSLYGALTRQVRGVYDLLYDATDRPLARPLVSGLLRTVGERRVCRLLDELRPDVVVVCNGFHMGDLFAAARRRRGGGFTLVTMVTDPVSVHESWFSAGVDLHFLVGAQGASRFSRQVPTRSVAFPVHPAFARTEPGRDKARELLGLHRDRPVALIAGGGAGGGSRRTWLGLLHTLAATPDVQLLVAAGMNSEIVALLRHSEFSDVHVLAPTGSLELPLRAASMMFSKAGPASIFEAGALGVPVRLFDEVGMQERGNIAYARSLGLAEALAGADPVRLVRAAEARERAPRPDLSQGATQVASWISQA